MSRSAKSLPGPASSQLGVAIGTLRAGPLGGLAAWLGFTLPSAVILIGFALLADPTSLTDAAWSHGLQLAAIAVVAQAVWQMRRSLAPDATRRAIALAAFVVALAVSTPLTSAAVILGGAILGPVVVRRLPPGAPSIETPSPVGRRGGILAIAAFGGLLVGLPLVRATADIPIVTLADPFYRSGALVFGGGHVVLPLLDDAIVGRGWVDEGRFLAGYGAAQAVPGPLFTFAGYLGAIVSVPPGGVAGAVVALIAIFLPGILLVWAALPFWDVVRTSGILRRMLAGVGAAVVGLLAAALYSPVWTGAVGSAADAVVAIAALAALVFLRAPPLACVVGCAAVAQILGLT